MDAMSRFGVRALAEAEFNNKGALQCITLMMATGTDDANAIRNLWESRTKRGLLPVLEEMNELLARGVISQSAFQAEWDKMRDPTSSISWLPGVDFHSAP